MKDAREETVRVRLVQRYDEPLTVPPEPQPAGDRWKTDGTQFTLGRPGDGSGGGGTPSDAGSVVRRGRGTERQRERPVVHNGSIQVDT